jgi:hypothetical protein
MILKRGGMVRKQIKKDYIIKVYQDGDIINEIKLENSKKKILIHKYNQDILDFMAVHQMHKELQRLKPKLHILSIPKTSEIEIYEIR